MKQEMNNLIEGRRYNLVLPDHRGHTVDAIYMGIRPSRLDVAGFPHEFVGRMHHSFRDTELVYCYRVSDRFSLVGERVVPVSADNINGSNLFIISIKDPQKKLVTKLIEVGL